jgi:SET domain-containing protein
MKISWTNPKIKHSSSDINGKGVYATEKIKKDELIAVFGGFVCSFEELDAIRETDVETYNNFLQTAIQIDKDLIYSPTREDQYSDIEYLNHSCEPNAGFKSPLHLIAMRDIAGGEEITMDYAMCISSDIFAMECECGRPNCRKEITEYDWKMPELQEKYADYFQPYIKEMIKENN